MGNILDGKAVADEIKKKLLSTVEDLKQHHKVTPKLAIVQVGNDTASQIYIQTKLKTLNTLGMSGIHVSMDHQTKQPTLDKAIRALNNDQTVHGIIIQLPLPAHLDREKTLSVIHPGKDVDGLTTSNLGLLYKGVWDGFLPCTPLGCLYLLKKYNLIRPGALAVILGRSNLVGKPLGSLLLAKNCTVIQTHSSSYNLSSLTSLADIIVSATGVRGILLPSMIKPGATIIDVGIHRLENGVLSGDIDYASFQETAGFITPVPGGVGPMTVAMLMLNTVLAAQRKNNLSQNLYKTLLNL